MQRKADERRRERDAATSSINAEVELIGIRRLRLENRVDLYLALGGGFEQLDDPIQTSED